MILDIDREDCKIIEGMLDRLHLVLGKTGSSIVWEFCF